ncbi:MAG: BatA domain-containing protein [Flavobacteriaceae bacterium]|nr:BatA domain-containing protein [Flavobacteriaceae bacterium]
MQFKHPEILYALLLLIIPIIVHLFQLQRFVKTPFTNVQFLKQLKLETRKSSRIKKWLILATRLLSFIAMFFAFSQPFFSDVKKNQKYNTTIYLDNSLSMQLKTQQVELLKMAIQEIIENSKNNTTVSLITNDKVFKKLDQKSLKNELLNLKYSSGKLGFNNILLKSNQLNNNKINSLNNLVLISDFQEVNKLIKSSVTNVNSRISLIKLTSNEISNVSIDSIYINKINNKEVTLKVIINNTNIERENVPVSLYKNTILIGKTTTRLSKNKVTEVEFKIPNNKKFDGTVQLNDPFLTFDNTLFFSISKPEKTNIISIGKNTQYLSKIYTKKEFNFSQKTLNNLDYNSIQNQHLIILHELEKIPIALANALYQFAKNGGNIVLIPSKNNNIPFYNQFLSKLNLGEISTSIKKELKITNINFAHPLMSNVFEKKVLNFQYPTVNQHYKLKTNNSSPIISFENEQPFISEIKTTKGSVYLFSSPLDNSVTNFKNSPLIVPIFYNFGKYSFKIPQLYYTVGKENIIEINTSVKKDEILKLKNETSEFIPLQQVFHNKVQLNTSEQPKTSGFYQVMSNTSTLRSVAYNYNREENDLNYTDLRELFKNESNVSISNSIKKTFKKLNEQQKIKPLFKWFLAFAILFLLLEIFILKFFKV